MDPHEEHMRRVLELAQKGEGYTRPNPMVGCVIVNHSKVVGEGYHLRAGEPHAEVFALKNAGPRAQGGTLYVNLEPCAHHGRTPPCVDAVIAAGVARVVVAHQDNDPRVDGGGIAKLREAGVEVIVGVLEKEARALNEAFLFSVERGRPLVIAKIAQSLDGKVATCTGESKWITSEAAREEGHRLRHRCDTIMVGKNTVLRDDPQLTARIKGGVDPIPVILDSKLQIPASARVFANGRKYLRYYAGGVESEGRKYPGRRYPSDTPTVDLGAMMEDLHARKIRSVLLEGGPTLLGAMLQAGFVDKIVAFIAPILLGGDGLPAIPTLGIETLRDKIQLEPVACRAIGDDLMWVHRVQRRRI